MITFTRSATITVNPAMSSPDGFVYIYQATVTKLTFDASQKKFETKIEVERDWYMEANRVNVTRTDR